MNNHTIWKFPLNEVAAQSVPLPKGAKILTVQLQHGRPCLWAIVNPDAPVEPREIRIHGTGDPLPPDANQYKYLGTYQWDSGRMVFHVFLVQTLGEMVGSIL